MDLRDYQSGQVTAQDILEQLKRYLPQIAAALLVVVILFVGFSTFYRIDASAEGVVLRFGRHIDTVEPGLHWKLPWPIDTVYEVPVQRIQSLEFGFATERPGRVTEYSESTAEHLGVSEMLTGDLNLANVQWIVQYRIKDANEFLFNLGGTESIADSSLPSGELSDVNPAVPDTIGDTAESVVRTLVGNRSVDAVLTFGREEIAADAKLQIQQMLDSYQAGIEIVTVKLQSTSPPEKVKDAFQEVNRARQNKERVVNEAEGERNRQIPAARGKKEQAILEAEGYRERLVLETTGRIDAFEAQLTEYEQAKEVTRMRLHLEAVEQVLAGVGEKTIIDESVRGMVPLLNLDRNTPMPAPIGGP
ncbi:MAG: FtsH protease activity modulator HflK [Candidatus Nealsonbacteria bacterium]|nr:FtsH protease activity modulator HflK [Candidatus Nealsonbacteria bacterium]